MESHKKSLSSIFKVLRILKIIVELGLSTLFASNALNVDGAIADNSIVIFRLEVKIKW